MVQAGVDIKSHPKIGKRSRFLEKVRVMCKGLRGYPKSWHMVTCSCLLYAVKK
jgi:hypothetical protein